MEEQYYHFHTNEIDRYFHKDPEDANRYLVFTCAKGEDSYLKEWIDHYLGYGFDKIIICDNNDTDTLSEVLKDYIENGTVEIFDCRGFNSFQVQIYSMFATEGNYKWCAYFDCDEFLELNIYTNIKEFLSTINENCVSFNWIVYGSNGIYHRTEGNVQDRFTVPVKPIIMFKENVFIKSIVKGGEDRVRDLWFDGSHIPIGNDKDGNPNIYNIGGYHTVNYGIHTHFPPRYKCGYIKHYYTKSFDEWINKSSRGWPDGTPTLNTANIFLCDNNSNFPISKFTESFFIDSTHLHNICENWKEMIDTYDVIQVNNSSKQVYAFIAQLISMMAGCTKHTFIITEPHIDDTMFAILLEYGIETGNNVVYAKNHDEVWKTYLRYSDKRAGTYYIIDLK